MDADLKLLTSSKNPPLSPTQASREQEPTPGSGDSSIIANRPDKSSRTVTPTTGFIMSFPTPTGSVPRLRSAPTLPTSLSLTHLEHDYTEVIAALQRFEQRLRHKLDELVIKERSVDEVFALREKQLLQKYEARERELQSRQTAREKSPELVGTIVKLNVGGQIFHTTIQTLSKVHTLLNPHRIVQISANCPICQKNYLPL